MKNIALIVSGALNLAFLAGFAATYISASGSEPQVLPSPAADKAANDSVTMAAPVSHKGGSTDSTAKLLRLQELEFQYRDSLPPPADKFWTPSQEIELANYLFARLEADRAIRDTLLSEFGNEARTAPEFRTVFYPLDMQHPYLSSEDQIRLRDYQTERQIELINLNRVQGNSPSGSGELDMTSVPPHPNSGVETILGPEALYEYQLRTSPLAKKIANADLGFDEQQFRSIYKVLQSSLPGPGKPPTKTPASINSELAAMVGETGALKVMAALDSNFESVKSAGLQQGLSENKIYQAYEILLESDQRVFEAYQIRDRDPEGSTRMISRAISDRREQLTRFVGDAAAAAIIEARRAPAGGSAPRLN